MSKAGFNMADLQKGAKRLNPVAVGGESNSDAKFSSSEFDMTAIKSLEDLYDANNGDLDSMYVLS